MKRNGGCTGRDSRGHPLKPTLAPPRSPGKGSDITWTACSEREARDLTLSSDAKSQHISG